MYKIIFRDGETYWGGNPENSNWGNIPNKPISELHYDYLGKKIYLKNYESYNHLIKHAFRIDNQKQFITEIIIMALEKNMVKRIIFDLINRKILVDNVPVNREYNNKPISGWKIGLYNLIPEFKISP